MPNCCRHDDHIYQNYNSCRRSTAALHSWPELLNRYDAILVGHGTIKMGHWVMPKRRNDAVVTGDEATASLRKRATPPRPIERVEIYCGKG